MEFFPTKIDWAVYHEKLANDEFLPGVCLLECRCDDPPDAGSLNLALSDFFRLLLPHLPESVCGAIGPFIGAIASCGIDGWPPPNDGPEWLYDNSRDLSDIAPIGQLCSPATVTEIVRKFESVPVDQLKTALADAWSLKSNDPADYYYETHGYFHDSEDLFEYLMAWYAPFREAAVGGHGFGIAAG